MRILISHGEQPDRLPEQPEPESLTASGGTAALLQRTQPEGFMFLALFLIFFVCWVFGFVVFHVAGGLIHALLIVALISLIWHFVSARTTV
jgi:hypothetical protein